MLRTIRFVHISVYNIGYEVEHSVFKENLRISNVIFNYFLNSLWCGTLMLLLLDALLPL